MMNQQSSSDPTNQEPLCNNPAKEAALRELCQATGYALKQENGQRKYGGPPPNWTGAIPGKGCEIFVGKLPRDLYEDELVPVLEKCGRIFELRLMMDFNGNNRGFAFVKYCAQNDARRALKELNNYEIRKGRLLGVCKSVDNCRLFVGGIPKTKTKDEILIEMQKITEGVVNAIVYPSAADKTKNRGFAFVEYQDHHTAAMARRKLMHTRPQVWGHPIAVDWAEPEVEVDDDVMATVKILYVRNLMLNTTEEQLEKEFTAIVPLGAIERVKKIRDYGFVHFNTRENALKCMHALNGKMLDGAPMEVTLAKPVDRETYVRYTRAANRAVTEAPETFAAYPFITTYDTRIDPTAAAAAAYPYTAGTPIYYGGIPYAATTLPAIPSNPRYAVPSQLQTIGVPQIGAAGVPLGIPGATTGMTGAQGRGVSIRGRNRGVVRGAATRSVLNLGRGYAAASEVSMIGGDLQVLTDTRQNCDVTMEKKPKPPRYPTTYFNQYRRLQWPQQPQAGLAPRPEPGEKFDLLPGTELIPINPSSLKPSNLQKSSAQMLEEYCMRVGLGKPEYKLHSAGGQNGRQLFLYRVELHSSGSKSQEGSQQPGSPNPNPPANLYTPTKLCTSLEMAKEVAAAHVLAAVNAEQNSDTNNSNSHYVSDDITANVATMSISNGGVKGYVYNNADGGIGGYGIYNGIYQGAHNEGFQNLY